ncbi:MAG: type II secretion system F family protein [Phycisphaerales bacterium]
MSVAIFEYRAVDSEGKARRGVVRATNEADAYQRVAALSLTPTRLTMAEGVEDGGSARAGGRGRWRRARRAGLKDLAHFTYQLGVLMSSRIPIGEGLESIAEQEREGELKSIIRDVAGRIEAGESVAGALGAHERVFGDVYIQSIRAAERSGNLAKVMDHLSDMLEREQEMRGQVKAALAYPVCVLVVLLLAAVFLVGFVVPRFAKMFESRNIDLPAMTRAMMVVGQSLQEHWYLYAAGVAAAVIGVRRWAGSPGGARVVEDLVHGVPQLGQILRGLGLARFSRVLGLSVSSGLGLIEALELAGRASGRARLRADAERMAQRVRIGGSLADALPSCGYATPFVRRMLAAGEKSGELPRMCGVVARHYERESSLLARSISTVIEPVLIVGIAGVVLVVALAIFMPMWDMVKLVG